MKNNKNENESSTPCVEHVHTNPTFIKKESERKEKERPSSYVEYVKAKEEEKEKHIHTNPRL
jgi:hypothetical protein